MKNYLRKLKDYLLGIRLLEEKDCGCRIYRNWEKVTEYCPKHTRQFIRYGSVDWKVLWWEE